MKIVVYEANSEVPFSDFFKRIGGNKVIFSNAKEKIAEFDEQQTIPLLNPVTPEDDTIFYVPENISNWFVNLMKQLKETESEKIELEKIEITEADKMSLKKTGVIGSGWEKLSPFFEEMIIRRVLRLKKECPKECVNLLNDIVNHEDVIDIIFLYDFVNKVIAGDIGYSRSYLGIFEEGNQNKPVLIYPNGKPQEYYTKEHPSMESLVKTFLQQANIKEPLSAACFGISGPPDKGITGLSWRISEEVLCDFWIKEVWNKTKCDDAKEQRIVTVINSLEGIYFDDLEEKSIVLKDSNATVDHTDENSYTPKRALITVRGGLGEGLISWKRPPEDEFGEKRFFVSFSEGGHSNFAPSNRLEADLLIYLLDHPNYLEHPEHPELVTYQQVLSEKGMVCMYQFFKDRNGGEDNNATEELKNAVAEQDYSRAAKEIFRAALEEKNALCVKVLNLFLSVYGAEAGNVALKNYATGSVYVSCTITPPELVDKLIDTMKQPDGAFLRSFTNRAKPKLVELLDSIPVKFVKDSENRLRIDGAAQRALEKVHLARIIYDECT
jgi:glucokinase